MKGQHEESTSEMQRRYEQEISSLKAKLEGKKCEFFEVYFYRERESS